MNKRQIRGSILLCAGILLVCVALGIHLLEKHRDQMAGQTAQLLLQQLDLSKISTEQAPTLEEAEQQDPQLPEKYYMDYPLIGSIYVPAMDVRLPVLNRWDEDMLEVAPCRYEGGISSGSMIIMGHNYRSHFRFLHSLPEGAEVVFENTAGREFRYRVAHIDYLQRNQGEKLPSEHPLILFTCTPGGLERIVVRCEAVQ